jgi:hypothetical protein
LIGSPTVPSFRLALEVFFYGRVARLHQRADRSARCRRC